MANIFLKDSKVYLVNINLSEETHRTHQRPSVVVHADLSKIDISELSMPIIEVPKMSSNNELNPMLDMSFFYKKDRISFRMPVQFYAVSFALSKLSLYDMGGVGIYLVDSRKYPTINPAVVLPLESVELGLMFDPKRELQYSGALRGNVHHSMTSSLSHIPWIGIGVNGPSPMDVVNKTVLGNSLRYALSFANGNIPMNLFYTEEGKDLVYHSDQEMIIPDEERYFQLDNILERVRLSSPKYRSAYAENQSNDEEEDEDESNEDSTMRTNLIFNQLVSDLDIDSSVAQLMQKESFNDAKLNSWEQHALLWESNASESWNPIMISIYELFRDEGVIQEVETIINMLITGDYYDLIGKFDHQLVEIASSLYFAMQAHKLSSYTGEEVNDIIIEWFSETTDFNDHWMLEAMSEELFYLDNKNTSRLLKYKDGYKGYFAPVISGFAIFVGYILDSSTLFEETSREDIIKEINEYDFNHPSSGIVKNVLIQYISNIEQYEEEFFEARENGIDLPYQALLEKSINSLIVKGSSSGANVDYWAEAFSLVIPFISEIVSTRSEEKNSEEWNEVKQSLMVNLLSDFTKGLK